MEHMLVAVFDSDANAAAGSDALLALEEAGTIAIYAARVVSRRDDGETTVRNADDSLPEATMAATVLGSFLGLLGGPVGLAVGGVTGFALGAAADLTRARAGRGFVAAVTCALAPGKAAVVAAIDEENMAAVDARLTPLGARVFRRDQWDVENAEYDREIAGIGAAIAQAEADHATSRADRKRRLKARLDSLHKKLKKTLDRRKTQGQATATNRRTS
jgi:uncharacterized membrane protein